MDAVFDRAIFVDSSAVLALADPTDSHHSEAKEYRENQTGIVWATLNATCQESFTRIRYDLNFEQALKEYDELNSVNYRLLRFDEDDEKRAREILIKYKDHCLSFHDALCSAVMTRAGIYRVFTFDNDFWKMGFRVEPGPTR